MHKKKCFLFHYHEIYCTPYDFELLENESNIHKIRIQFQFDHRDVYCFQVGGLNVCVIGKLSNSSRGGWGDNK